MRFEDLLKKLQEGIFDKEIGAEKEVAEEPEAKEPDEKPKPKPKKKKKK